MATTYKKINPIKVDEKLTLDELKVDVHYNKGGYNSKRGVYVYVTPTHREDRGNGFTSEVAIPIGYTKTSGFRTCLRELGRKSQKVEDEISAKVFEQADKMAELWNEEKFEDVVSILRSI